jgi:hypothetical protein
VVTRARFKIAISTKKKFLKGHCPPYRNERKMETHRIA